MIQFALSFVLAVSQGIGGAPRITLDSLLTEMNNPASLAQIATPKYKQLQFSSYDRSRLGPDNLKTWFNNHDYGQFIRTEQNDGRTEWVVMEHDGPGAITRIWTPLSADKDNMLVRFYFDGSNTPAIEEKFNDLMRGNSFIKTPYAFIAWPDGGETAGVGSDCYFPFPFAKSCKVTFSEEPFYYSISFRAYSSLTRVDTFNREMAVNAEDRYRLPIRTDLGLPLTNDPRFEGAASTDGHSEITLSLPDGPAAVTGLNLIVPSGITSEQLRSTIIEMTFDGEKTVWCPIGEFFGCGLHLRSVWDKYRRVMDDGFMSCQWVMPYQHSATIHVFGLGADKVNLKPWATSRPWKWDDRSLLFHSNWHYQDPLPTRPMSDWNYLGAQGQGVYVGDTLTVVSPSPAWYGEGDEKVYVDGERFPSHLGTGTEDYYGYAWGMAEHFSSDYISMPRRDLKGRDNWTGITTTSRDRGLDAIPFDRSLKFDMEIWDWADCNLAYSVATFWYARPGASTNRTPDPEGALKPQPQLGIKGALECEVMDVLSKSDDVNIETQSGNLVSSGTWSMGSQLFIKNKAVGDFTELQVPVQKAGRQHVILYATKSYDYGIVKISIDGKIAKEIDLWNKTPVTTGPIDLGEFDLKNPQAVLRVEVIGTNPQSVGPRYYTGLDCVVLKPSHSLSRH